MSHCDEALKTIGQALKDYRQARGDHPARLQDLIETQNLSPWLLICPAGREALGQTSYLYRGPDLPPDAPDDMILAYDTEPRHRGRRNLLFNDGSVQRLAEKRFRQALQTDNDHRRRLNLALKPA